MYRCAGALSIAALLAFTAPAGAATCEGVVSAALKNVVISAAEVVGAGTFTPPEGTNGAAARPETYAILPTFCRVQASIHPTADSDIGVEVWLPASDWNGKLEVVGNGGWAGSISYGALASAVAAGYAAASTDTGHTGGGAGFVIDHPEKLIDFGPRSVHELTVVAKALVQAYYTRNARRAYFAGCSTGGRQGLQEAQRYPGDFDGIVAGAPANDWSNMQSHDIWMAQAAKLDPASRLGPEQFALLSKGALAKCDFSDGLRDGVISDPLRCRFDPASLQCKGSAAKDCLSPAQVAAARKIYSPVINPRTKQLVHAPLLPGSEFGWNTKIGGPDLFAIPNEYFRNVVFKDPNWDWRGFDFDQDIATATRVDANNINATDPNLHAFQAHGGKLLQYHGWADALIAPEDSLHYRAAVANAMGGESAISTWYRLFMVPGMGHCGGGPGTDQFDMVAALDQWVETGDAPESIPAAHKTDGEVDRTRPLCPYPQRAHYKGEGGSNDAANFSCR